MFIIYCVATVMYAIFEISDGGVPLRYSYPDGNNDLSLVEPVQYLLKSLNDLNTTKDVEVDDNSKTGGEFGTGDNKLWQQEQRMKSVNSAVPILLSSIAKTISDVAAVPVKAVISLVNRLYKVTNHTLHVGGEMTKLPSTITNTIIQKLSNITFPNK